MAIRKTLVILGAAALAATGAPAAIAETGAAARPPIVGGHTVDEAPWAASVYQSGAFACSGTIIASTWVLTAQHCSRSDSITVRVGDVSRSRATTIRVTRVVTSPNGDLALFQLQKPYKTTYSQLADTDPQAGSTNQICGWGRTKYPDGPTSDKLKCADVRVTSTSCTDAYGGRAMCSSKINGYAWKGDSGGPELFNGQQVGVASTANGSGNQTYASVAFGRSWIHSVAGV
ncbi:S1 family peptidase [Actinomadura luteofluorescens]|uniref:S1 family peptidase n=1 Tax=Actinomadura luteofluorescens TaxID=46163 RepID=UPI003475D443